MTYHYQPSSWAKSDIFGTNAKKQYERTGPNIKTKGLAAISFLHQRKPQQWTQCTKKGGGPRFKKNFHRNRNFSRKLISLRNIVLVTAAINYTVRYFCHDVFFYGEVFESRQKKSLAVKDFSFVCFSDRWKIYGRPNIEEINLWWVHWHFNDIENLRSQSVENEKVNITFGSFSRRLLKKRICSANHFVCLGWDRPSTSNSKTFIESTMEINAINQILVHNQQS